MWRRLRSFVEIAGEVQVDAVGRHDLGVAAAGGAALHAQAGSQRGFAQRDADGLAEAGERLAESDRRRRLALAGAGRRGGGDQDQLARLFTRQVLTECVDMDLRDLVAVGNQVARIDAETLRNVRDRLARRAVGDFAVGAHVGWNS
jgi:hypothetical protein